MTPKQSVVALSVAMLAFIDVAQADSAKLTNPNNGHTYQRIDQEMTWIEAKNRCQFYGGHLATITAQSENDFIANQLVIPSNHDSWLGATDTDSEGTWKWITGESFMYTNWATGAPDDFCGGEDYLQMIGTVDRPGKWNDQTVDGSCNNFGLMYPVCEWESSQYLDVTAIPDVNGDGVMDQAVLAMNAGNYYLRTIDSATGKQLKQVTLGTPTDITPSALTAIGKQISVLITKQTGVSVLQLRNNATLALVKTLTLPK